MASNDKQINELPESAVLNDGDFLVVQVSGVAKHLKGSTLKQYIADANVYLATNGGTMTGHINYASDIDVTTNPSTMTTTRASVFTAANGNNIGFIRAIHDTNGEISTELNTRRVINGSIVSQNFRITIGTDGKKYIYTDPNAIMRSHINIRNNAKLQLFADSITVGVQPSSNTYGPGIKFYDNASVMMGQVEHVYYTNGNEGLLYETQRVINGTKKYNALGMLIDNNGNPVISISSPDAWKSALGIHDQGSNDLKVSIIGDSISTYDQAGYKIDGYEMHYPASDVTNVNLTWWKKVIDAIGGKIDVNAAYGRTRATLRSGYPDFYARTSLLNNPDVIFVELGTNDSSGSVSLGNYDFSSSYANLSESTFRTAYIKGCKSLMDKYPGATIYLVILTMTDDYANSIKYIGTQLGLTTIDARGYTAYDGTHPNAKGMTEIAASVLYAIDSGYSVALDEVSYKYLALAGGRMTGTIISESNNINISSGAAAPSSNQYGDGFQFRDSQNNRITLIRPYHLTTNVAGFQMTVERYIGTTRYLNQLLLGVNASGTPVVDFQSDAVKNAWLSALGLTGPTTTEDFKSKVTFNTTYTNGNYCSFYKNGNIIQINVMTNPATVFSADGTTTNKLFTIPSGYRPSSDLRFPCTLNTGYLGIVWVCANGDVLLNTVANRTASGRIYANLVYLV